MKAITTHPSFINRCCTYLCWATLIVCLLLWTNIELRAQSSFYSNSPNNYLEVVETKKVFTEGEKMYIKLRYVASDDREISVALWKDEKWAANTIKVIKKGKGVVTVEIEKPFPVGDQYQFKIYIRPIKGNWKNAFQTIQIVDLSVVKPLSSAKTNTLIAGETNVYDFTTNTLLPIDFEIDQSVSVSVMVMDPLTKKLLGVGEVNVDPSMNQKEVPVFFMIPPQHKKDYLLTVFLNAKDGKQEVLDSFVKQITFNAKSNLSGSNLVKNPSFENKEIAPWTHDQWTKVEVMTSMEASEGRNLAYVHSNTGLGQQISVKPFTNYEFTARIRTKTPNQQVFLGVKDYGNKERGMGINKSNYEYYSLQFTTGDTRTASIYLWCPKNTDGAFIDEVSVLELKQEKEGANTVAVNDGFFEKYNSNMGLSQNDVLDIYQDKYGYMWFATHDGLNRFDGYNFTVFKPDAEDPNSLGSNLIYGIVEDQQGNIWVRTISGGLNRFDRHTEKFTRFFSDPANPKSVRDDFYHECYIDKSNTLWVSNNQGLGYMPLTGTEKDTIQNFTYLNFTDEKEVITGFLDLGNGRMLFGSSKGVIYERIVEKDGTVILNRRETGFDTAIICMLVDANGKLIVGQDWGLIYQIQKGQDWRFIQLQNFGGKHEDIAFDKDGFLWASTSLDGLKKFSISEKAGIPQLVGHYKTDINDPNSISSDALLSMEIDDKGIVWVGTANGIDKLNPNRVPFKHFKKTLHPKSLRNSRVRPIHEDQFGGLWVGLGHAINYKPSKYHKDNYNSFMEIPVNDPFAFLEVTVEDKPFMLVGTRGNTFSIPLKKDYEGYSAAELPKLITKLDPLEGASVFDLEKDSYQQIWIASYNRGLIKWSLDPKDALHHTPRYYLGSKLAKGQIADIFIRAIHFSKNKELWVGTSKGVRRIKADDILKDSVDFEVFRHDPNDKSSLSLDYISAIAEDNDGNIWAGTLGAGINKMILDESGNVIEVIRITEKDGLSNNVVHGIINDHSGYLWVSTNQGITKITPATLEMKSFNIDDGLQGNEFRDLSAYINSQGEIYMGGANGVNVFYPDSIYNSTAKPDVILTDLLINNKAVKGGEEFHGRVLLEKTITETKEILLTYKENNFALNFSAMHYAAPLKNQYLYKLEGFDEDWVSVSANRRSATYTNLKPGDYTFKVKASNNDNLWDEQGVSLKIKVTPPWWQTIWFRALVFLLITGSAFGYYKNRTLSLKRRQEELENQVNERTSELKNANQSLQKQHEEIRVQAEELAQQAEELEAQRDHLTIQNKVITSKNDLIATLSEVGRKITASIDIDNIVKSMYKNVNRMVDAKYFEIGVIYQDESKVSFHGFHETTRVSLNHSDLRYKMGDLLTLTQYVVKEQKPIILNDLQNEIQQFVGKVQIEKYLQEPYHSVVYYPLSIGDRLVGIMVAKSKNKEAYSKEVVDILASIADYATISVDNATTYEEVQQKTENITASIRYAQTIQEAILPFQNDFKKNFKESFVLFRPKDIVSGDFYWMSRQADKVFLAAIDCTGHGVPGAFMSMIGSSLLNRIVNEQKVLETDNIIDLLDKGIRTALKQNESKNDDGMDLVFCSFTEGTEGGITEVSFTGAKNPLYHYSQESGTLIEYKGDKKAIGGVRKSEKEFTSQIIKPQSGDAFYLITDGIIDQNRADRKRFGKMKFMQLLTEQAQLNMAEQNVLLAAALDEFQGEEQQRDDITVVGVRV